MSEREGRNEQIRNRVRAELDRDALLERQMKADEIREAQGLPTSEAHRIRAPAHSRARSALRLGVAAHGTWRG